MLGTWLAIRTRFGPNDQAVLGDLVDALSPSKFDIGVPVRENSPRSYLGVNIDIAELAKVDTAKVNAMATTPAESILTDPPTELRWCRCRVLYEDLPQTVKDDIESQRWALVDWGDIDIWDYQNNRLVTLADIQS